jgi:hypothetical protein
MAGLTAAILGGAGIASSLAGGIVGSIASSGDKEKAAAALDQADAIINQLQLPPDQARPIIIQQLQNAGVWKPEMEQHIDVGISKVSQIQEDPAFKQKQMATLRALEQISETGMTAQGRAEFNRLRAQAQQSAEAKRQQVLQGMQARGMAGAGAELAMQLQAAQGGAQTEAEAADRIAAEQEAARMSALGQLGSMAGQVRGQEFGIEKEKSSAADAFKMFDVQQQIAQQQRNIAAKQEAAKYDVMNRQALANTMWQAQLAEQQRQRQGELQNYAAQVQRAQLQAGQKQARAGQYAGQAQATAQGYGTMGSAIGGGLMTLAGKSMGKTKAPDTSPTVSTSAAPSAPAPQFGPERPEVDLEKTDEEYYGSNLGMRS